jgi:hypothetical protein
MKRMFFYYFRTVLCMYSFFFEKKRDNKCVQINVKVKCVLCSFELAYFRENAKHRHKLGATINSQYTFL